MVAAYVGFRSCNQLHARGRDLSRGRLHLNVLGILSLLASGAGAEYGRRIMIPARQIVAMRRLSAP